MFNTSTRDRMRAIPAVAALAALVLTASCSGDDDDATASTEDATASSTTDAPDPTDAPEATAASTTDAPATTDGPETSEAPDTTEPSGDFDPYAQTLEWSECDLGECAEMIVPIDYDDPSVGTTTVVLSRLTATGPDRIGTLFVNPGGPGASGLGLPSEFESGAPEVLASYDIVGFDPRGVGQSDPVGCLDDADLDVLHATDVDPDDPDSVETYTELVVGQGEACLATNPELAQHVTTVETAKDIDVMRELVGDDQLHYLGFSYGTFLGSTYAALFPDKVGRMVLDGPEDPSLSEAEKGLITMGGFQLAFDDYAADCVENDCPLGASVDEIEQQVIEMFETAEETPLSTDDPDRSLTRPLAFYGIAAPLYNQELWPELTEALAGGFDGDGTVLLALADEYLGRTDGGYPANTQVIVAINCLDLQLAPPSTSQPTEDDFLAASPVFGQVAYDLNVAGCDTWPIEPTVTAPDYTASGAAPIVVIGTTGDPATPFANAGKLADQLESGVLLVRDGEGHTAYFSGNACISETVDAYLLEGTVPEDGLECAEEAPADDELARDVALISGDDVVILEWTECAWDGAALTLAAEGSGLEVAATTADDGTIEASLSGVSDATLSGTGAEDDAGIVTVTGTVTDADGTTAEATLSFDAATCA